MLNQLRQSNHTYLKGHQAVQEKIGQAYLATSTMSDEESISFHRKAASEGFELSQFFVGLRYEEGDGVPQNYETAMQWYREAADKGFSGAQFNLGVLYEKAWAYHRTLNKPDPGMSWLRRKGTMRPKRRWLSSNLIVAGPFRFHCCACYIGLQPALLQRAFQISCPFREFCNRSASASSRA